MEQLSLFIPFPMKRGNTGERTCTCAQQIADNLWSMLFFFWCIRILARNFQTSWPGSRWTRRALRPCGSRRTQPEEIECVKRWVPVHGRCVTCVPSSIDKSRGKNARRKQCELELSQPEQIVPKWKRKFMESRSADYFCA